MSRLLSCFLGLPLVFTLLFAGCGGYEVDLVTPQKATIEESFTEPAITRLANTYLVTMPLSGRIGRLGLEPGDNVEKGALLVEFDTVPLRQAVAEANALLAELEAGARPEEIAQVAAAVEGAQAFVDQLERGSRKQEIESASMAVEQAQAEVQRTEKEYNRALELRQKGVLPDREFQAIEAAYKVANAALGDVRARLSLLTEGPRIEEKERAITALREARARLELVKQGPREEQIARAKARLATAQHNLQLADIRSPITGTVLEKYEDGDRTLAAGQPLLLLGSLAEMEVAAEVLTQDALRLSPGGPVALESGAGDKSFTGTVTKIEPAGFTKLSSLGVEQQRVRVIVGVSEGLPVIGVGYRVNARFITGSKENALVVPRFSILQAPDGTFYVFGIEKDRLRKIPVKLGLRSDLQIEILEGLTGEDAIVRTPEVTMRDGQRVVVRETQ